MSRKILTFLLLLFCLQVCYAQPVPINLLRLPPGFRIQIFAYPLVAPREMAVGDNGTVFVGSLSGAVYAIVRDGTPPHGTRIITIARNLNFPNGVAFFNGDLYVGENPRIIKFANIESRLNNPPRPTIVFKDLPPNLSHGLRYLRIGPDQKIYFGIGSPCNLCVRPNPIFGTISRVNLNGSGLQFFARGIRNSVGFDFHPGTRRLWFTDNGSDLLGDFLPPEEVNEVLRVGSHFGFPYYEGHIRNAEFVPPPIPFVFPKVELEAHSAALGLKFYSGNMFPSTYRNQMFIAEHGSSSRSTKVGYQVMVSNGRVARTFISGWLQGQTFWGRPMDIAQLQDGSILISDDFAGVIYRVTYQGA